MKLFYAPTSPFARKVLVLIAEKQIAGIDLQMVNPFDLPPDLIALNPLSKVPALQLDDGNVLYDSPVICEFLDTTCQGSAFMPAAGQARWTVLRRQALADGLMDTTLALALEINRRPEHERSPQWIDRWCATIRRTVAVLEQDISGFGSGVDMSHVAVACALGYLDLRAAAHVAWRDGHPQLAGWFAAFEQRASMQSSRPL